MAITKISASVIADGAVTADKIEGTVLADYATTESVTSIAQSLSPKISTVSIANSSYTVLDDTAVDTSGGYLVISGSGFASGAQVLIGTTPATSTTVVDSETIRAQVPSANAGTYTLYVVNSDGGTAIRVNGLTYSGFPSWVTGSTLTGADLDAAIEITLSATDATSYANTTALPPGTTLLSNGYFYGVVTGLEEDTTYNFTVEATDAESQNSPRTFSITITAAQPDLNFSSRASLYLFDSTNGSNNYVGLTDAGSLSLTATPSGNVMYGSPTPYSPTGWALEVDYSSSGCTATPNLITTTYAGSQAIMNDALQLGNESNFTIEFLMRMDNWTDYSYFKFFEVGATTDSTRFSLDMTTVEGTQQLQITVGSTTSSTPYCTVSGSTVSGIQESGQWHHIAFSRSSFNLYLHIDGVLVGSQADFFDTLGGTTTAGKLHLGAAGSYNTRLLCKMTDFRITKGTALYSSSNFTPPSARLTSSGANCRGLLLQGPSFNTDNSGYDFSASQRWRFSKGGQQYCRMVPIDPYTQAEYDQSTNGASFAPGGGKWTFNNTTIALGPEGTSNWTLDFWVYRPEYNGQRSYFTIFELKDQFTKFEMDNNGRIVYTRADSTVFTTNELAGIGCWTHITIVRDGTLGQFRFYQQGVWLGTHDSLSFVDGSYNWVIGNSNTIGSTPRGLLLADMRLRTDYVPSGTIETVPTSPVSSDSNTKLLARPNTLQVYDATMRSYMSIGTRGQISTAQSKFGGSSLYLDDSAAATYTTRILPIYQYDDWGNGTTTCPEKTIEFWIYPVTGANALGYFFETKRYDGYGGIDFGHLEGSFRLRLNSGSQTVNGPSVSFDQWQHIVIQFLNSGQIAIYKNGVRAVTATISQASLTAEFNFVATNSNPFYIDDFRTSHYAVYGDTATIDVPTKAPSTY